MIFKKQRSKVNHSAWGIDKMSKPSEEKQPNKKITIPGTYDKMIGHK